MEREDIKKKLKKEGIVDTSQIEEEIDKTLNTKKTDELFESIKKKDRKISRLA